jgi:small subunit ribosomal protein S9
MKLKVGLVPYGIGRRKTSVAKVVIIPGKGTVFVNGKKGEKYFQCESQWIHVLNPLTSVALQSSYDIHANTHGGGLKGQADAIKLGVARALCYVSLENRPRLKLDGALTRDSRRKERKKYGLRKARKAPQYSKR